MTKKLFPQIPIKSSPFILILIIMSSRTMTDAQATPAYMSYYNAPGCVSCHTGGAYYTKSEGQAGLAAYLASNTPTCTAPQVLQNNICVTIPTTTCTPPLVLQNNVCAIPTLIDGTVSVVRMLTSMGAIDIKLFDAAAPVTVANFLSYVESGAYNYSFIHRSVPGFILQGGEYVLNPSSHQISSIARSTPVVNEFSSSRSNLRGTIAMAKVSGDPNSATSQWFFNLADNNANLDVQNGGFTVFGQVVEKSMSAVDSIAALPLSGNVFTQLKCPSPLPLSDLPELPLAPPTPVACSVKTNNLVTITSVSWSRSNGNASDSDRVFAYLEGAYPEYLFPANPLSPADSASSNGAGYYYRHYLGANAYIGTSNGVLYYLGPATQNQLLSLGALSDWLAMAIAAGY
jgi:cyclophilin family peptidyl-prolyl cis-trans isomerase